MNYKLQAKNYKLPFAFFGTPRLAAVFLDDLEESGYIPSLVVTTPDRKQGRGMELTPPPVKVWAEKRDIEVLQPEQFDVEFSSKLEARSLQLFVIIYYGKVLPKAVLDIPKHGVLNIHFSLLPRWRGTSPVRAAILNDDREVGTSIILLDERIDHGPVVAQKCIEVPGWSQGKDGLARRSFPRPSEALREGGSEGGPPRASELEERMTHESAKLLIEIMPSWVAGDIEAQEQNHDLATHCPTLEKDDGRITLSDDPYQNLLKIRAFDTTIGTHAFFERDSKRIRVQILDAHLDPSTDGGKLLIDRVKPEGKREMAYEEFARSGVKPI